jgi:uncharacterized membrane protein YgdD (TMEM256/DUF423 family)
VSGASAARVFAVCAALAGALAVVAGAFGAHALKAQLPVERLAVYDTAVRFQMFSVVGLFAAAWLQARQPQRSAVVAGACLLAALLLFCGSLYVIAFTGWRGLAMLAPLGGLAAIAGWLLLAHAAWQLR